MPDEPQNDAKREALREQGVLNPRSQDVLDPRFAESDFFDPRDLVQVKYEMLRKRRVEKKTVTHAASEFGVSRVTFYQVLRAFERRGVAGLVPKKRGPRGGHKLTSEVVDFLEESCRREPTLDSSELAALLAERFGVTVHPRSIERAMDRREKKRR